jgi:hypothetical protein
MAACPPRYGTARQRGHCGARGHTHSPDAALQQCIVASTRLVDDTCGVVDISGLEQEMGASCSSAALQQYPKACSGGSSGFRSALCVGALWGLGLQAHQHQPWHAEGFGLCWQTERSTGHEGLCCHAQKLGWQGESARCALPTGHGSEVGSMQHAARPCKPRCWLGRSCSGCLG